MSVQRDLDTLMGFDLSVSGEEGVVPAYLEGHYNRLGAIENIRESGQNNEFVLAALIRTVVLDEDEEIREAALSTLCDISGSDQMKRLVLFLASADAHETVLTTVLEQAVIFDSPLAKKIAARLVNHPDSLVSNYANQLLKN